jgi:predicted amidohydrolase YtcJ
MQPVEGGPADTLFVRGRVFFPGDTVSRRGALAVRAGRIMAVGPDDLLADLRGPATDVVDVAGGLLLPGFQDAHVHPIHGGLSMLLCDLYGSVDPDWYVARVAEYARENPDLPWVTGGGWSMEAFPGGTPRRELLDAVVPDRPVFLPNRDGHGAWVNSRALLLAGIDASTPDPVDGRIERDADGTPTGTLHEGAATLVARLLPPPKPHDLEAGLLAGQRYLFSLGVTGWQDAIVGSHLGGGPDTTETYLSMARSGALKARVVGALWWDRERGAEQLPELVERRADGAAGRFRATSVKIMQDGVAENFTAAMTQPYLDHDGRPTRNAGLSFVDPDALREYVVLLDRAGFQVHFHALGDRAVREALDALAAAAAVNGLADHRHHLAHLQVVHPDDVGRFAALAAGANLQPLWACHEPQMDELTIPFLGGDLAEHQYPFGDLHRSGAHLAMGSDWSVSSPDPLWGIHVAVNRVAPPELRDADAEEPPPLLPHQTLDLATALTAYTAGTAYLNHLDGEAGSLRPGAYADLAVLDRDPFEVHPSQISGCRVVRTYVQGELVHHAAADQGP